MTDSLRRGDTPPGRLGLHAGGLKALGAPAVNSMGVVEEHGVRCLVRT